MQAYRYQQLAYLIIPLLLGLEFFISARDEKAGREDTPLGYFVLDALGFISSALVPAIFIFTIWTVETRAFPLQDITLARLDRYGVLFLFFGSWWQVHMIGALRARRMKKRQAGKWYLWGPYLVLGIYISLLILWISPFGMKWASIALFLATFGVLHSTKIRPNTVERVLWILCILFFILENIGFMFMETVV